MFQLSRQRYLRKPILTFAPIPYLKLQYLAHQGDTEVAGFAVTAKSNPLYVEEFVTVGQDTNPIAVKLRDSAVADYFDECVDRGLSPESFARIWLHTHPGSSVVPSATDEETFARVFGRCDWAVMAILGRTGKMSARLAINRGPRLDIQIPTRIDWAAWPADLEQNAPFFDWMEADWRSEFETNVHPMPMLVPALNGVGAPIARAVPLDILPSDGELDEPPF